METKRLGLVAKILRVFSIVLIIFQVISIKMIKSILPSIQVTNLFGVIIAHIVLIALITIFIKMIEEDSDNAIWLGLGICVAGIIIGNVFYTEDNIIRPIYSGVLAYFLLFFIGTKISIDQNTWYEILSIVIIGVVVFSVYKFCRNGVGVEGSDSKTSSEIISDYEKINEGDTLEEVENKLGKKATSISNDEYQKNVYFDYGDLKLDLILGKTTDENNQEVFEVGLKEISYFGNEKLLSNPKISFKNFDEIKSKFDTEFTYDDVKSALGGQDGIEVRVFYGVSNRTYLFADTKGNYIEIECKNSKVGLLSGEVEGEHISKMF